MEDNSQLIARIEALEKWREEKTAQQIAYPLDVNSVVILNKSLLSITGNLDFTSATGNVLPNIIVQQNSKQYVISVQENLIIYTPSASADTLTLGRNITSGNQGSFANGTQVLVSSTGTPPTPLVDSTPYYVVNASGNVIKLSLTFGGAAIDLTDVGTGQQYIQFFN